MSKKKRGRPYGAAAILIAALAFLAGMYFKDCGPFASKTPGGEKAASEKGAQPVRPSRTQPASETETSEGAATIEKVTLELRDDRIYWDERELSWLEFDVLMRRVKERDQLLEVVYHNDTLHVGFVARVGRELGQHGVTAREINK